MDATAGLLLTHVPPGTEVDKVVLSPAQMVVVPVIGANGFTVIVFTAWQPPIA
jgi:hypothetical protein